jgi:hypothetical protein
MNDEHGFRHMIDHQDGKSQEVQANQGFRPVFVIPHLSSTTTRIYCSYCTYIVFDGEYLSPSARQIFSSFVISLSFLFIFRWRKHLFSLVLFLSHDL